MKNNILKFSLFLFILFSFIFLLNNNCYATISTNYGDFPDNETYTSEDYHYIIMNKAAADTYSVIFIPKTANFYLYIDTDNKVNIYNNNSISLSIYYCDYIVNTGYGNISTRSIAKYSNFTNSAWVVNTSTVGNYTTDGLRHLIYSEFNIYNGSNGYNNNSIFMYATTSNQNEEEVPKEELTPYDVANNIYTILTVLVFIIIIFNLYKFLKACFKKK